MWSPLNFGMGIVLICLQEYGSRLEIQIRLNLSRNCWQELGRLERNTLIMNVIVSRSRWVDFSRASLGSRSVCLKSIIIFRIVGFKHPGLTFFDYFVIYESVQVIFIGRDFGKPLPRTAGNVFLFVMEHFEKPKKDKRKKSIELFDPGSCNREIKNKSLHEVTNTMQRM